MSALAAVLTLAVQVVTLNEADLPAKPVYVRVGVGVDSRVTLPEALVRLHGRRATSEMLGLKLGQARPKAVLLLHPRSAGVGRLMFVGPTHSLRLVVEASSLGTAQEVELRVREEADAPSAVALPAPRALQSPASSVAPDTGPRRRATVAPRSTAPSVDGYPGPPPPRPSPSPNPQATPADPGGDDAPVHFPPREATATTSLAVTALVEPPAPSATSEPPDDGTPAPATITRATWRGGRPGQLGIVLEELRHEGDQLTLRARIEDAADAQVVRLDVDGTPAAVTLDRAGRTLIVVATIPRAAQARFATLVLSRAGRWHTAKLRLPKGGTR